MGIIFLQGLQVDTVIGVYGWEREVRQTLVLDIEMSVDITNAGMSDNLVDTLDYSEVAHRLSAFLQERQFRLIEAAAEQCASLLMDEWPLDGCRVRVAKPGAVGNVTAVGVLVERGKMCCG